MGPKLASRMPLRASQQTSHSAGDMPRLASAWGTPRSASNRQQHRLVRPLGTRLETCLALGHRATSGTLGATNVYLRYVGVLYCIHDFYRMRYKNTKIIAESLVRAVEAYRIAPNDGGCAGMSGSQHGERDRLTLSFSPFVADTPEALSTARRTVPPTQDLTAQRASPQRRSTAWCCIV